MIRAIYDTYKKTLPITINTLMGWAYGQVIALHVEVETRKGILRRMPSVPTKD